MEGELDLGPPLLSERFRALLRTGPLQLSWSHAETTRTLHVLQHDTKSAIQRREPSGNHLCEAFLWIHGKTQLKRTTALAPKAWKLTPARDRRVEITTGRKAASGLFVIHEVA